MNGSPVFLEKHQIDDIIASINKYPIGAGVTAQQLSKKWLTKRLKDQLKTIKLVKNEQAFTDFKKLVVMTYYESLMPPGSAVGVAAGIALGGPITQMSLSSFHSQMSGVALAFQKIRDFLTGSVKNRDPQMKIYFKRNDSPSNDLHEIIHEGTFNSIFEKRKEFEQITINDITISKKIIQKDEIEKLNLKKYFNMRISSDKSKTDDFISGFKFNYAIQLTLNKYRLYTHRIHMSMIAKSLEGCINDVLYCVWKSQNDGNFYILIDESKSYTQYIKSDRCVKEMINNEKDVSIIMFMKLYLLPNLKSYIISGIKNIISLHPQELNIIDGIIRTKIKKNKLKVYTNHIKTRWDGISLNDIKVLLEAANYKVDPITPIHKEKLYVEINNYQGDGNIKKELTDAIAKIPEDQRLNNELYKRSKIYYAITNGSNIDEIIWRDDIDVYRCADNSSHGIAQRYGIDAARFFLVMKFNQTLKEFDTYINPRHINLVFDMTTNLGIINSLSFNGLNKRGAGTLTMMSFERAFSVLMSSVMIGCEETTKSISEIIFLGKTSKKMGTGAVDLEFSNTTVPAETMVIEDNPSITIEDIEDDTNSNLVSEIKITNVDITKAINQKPVVITNANVLSDRRFYTTTTRFINLRPIPDLSNTKLNIKTEKPVEKIKQVKKSDYDDDILLKYIETIPDAPVPKKVDMIDPSESIKIMNKYSKPT